MKNYKKIFLIRNILKAFSFIFIVLAFLGLSWGTFLVPVQKASASVAMVFDVSNSMNAKDCQNGNSRLEASAIYARKLLLKLQESGKVNISVVLAKGDGLNVIPLTEDYEIIYSLLEVINSSLVSAPGSSLGKGILAAKNSFSSDFSSANKIWLFTDGEETDNQLDSAIEDCIRNGIPVSIIGFGSENESEVFAGDGKTKVATALRKEKIFSIMDSLEKKYPYFKTQNRTLYVDAEEKGSAVKLLNQVTSASKVDDKSVFTAYESQKVPRFRLFLVIAICLYVFTYIFTEFDFSKIKLNKEKNNKSKNVIHKLMIFLICIVFTGCNNDNRFSDKTLILKGVNAFQHKKFNQSVSYFLKTEDRAREMNDQTLKDYAAYDLATCYIMQSEDVSAVKKLQEISDSASDIIKYCSFYNSGILAYRNGNIETAAEFFRKALEVDNTKIEAKVNLELSVNQIEIQARQNEAKLSGVQENTSDFSDEEGTLFEHIKENDKNQWKSLNTQQELNLAEDY